MGSEIDVYICPYMYGQLHQFQIADFTYMLLMLNKSLITIHICGHI